MRSTLNRNLKNSLFYCYFYEIMEPKPMSRGKGHVIIDRDFYCPNRKKKPTEMDQHFSHVRVKNISITSAHIKSLENSRLVTLNSKEYSFKSGNDTLSSTWSHIVQMGNNYPNGPKFLSRPRPKYFYHVRGQDILSRSCTLKLWKTVYW